MIKSRTANPAGIRRSGRRYGARRSCAGFTVLELLIAIGISVTVAAIAVPHLNTAIQAAKIARAVSDVRTIGNSALGFMAYTGAAPNSLADIEYNQNMDPWGHGYQYLVITASTDTALERQDWGGVAVNTLFDVYSMGPDGMTAPSLSAAQSLDDIVWANDGSYVGLGLNY